jgi:Family of unknown function (DUF6352)
MVSHGLHEPQGSLRSTIKDFWLSCGHHLLDRDRGGGLVVTDDFLKVYLARRELAPPREACVVERTLHAALLADPRRAVDADDIAAIADADARDNWAVMIAWRDLLVAHRTIEGAYLHLVRAGMGKTPPLFANQLVHVILRNLLDRCDDPFTLRAAELLFRPQRLTTHGGSLIAADDELIAGASPHSSPLVSMLGLPTNAAIDVLNDDNAATYWARSDRFDTALDLTVGRRGLAALGDVMVRWLRHLIAIDCRIEPLAAARGVDFNWYVGLDAQATAIGDALWSGETLDPDTQMRLIGLYRLTVGERAFVLDPAGGQPVYLLLAMAPDGLLRMKPQNLITGLPFRQFEASS